MEEVLTSPDPSENAIEIKGIELSDPLYRTPNLDWKKYTTHVYESKYGNFQIHFVYSKKLNMIDDVKIKYK